MSAPICNDKEKPCGCAQPEAGKMKKLKNTFACVCGCTGGMIAGHAGCVALPLLAATAGLPAAVAGSITLAAGTSAAIAGIGWAAWRKLRPQAPQWQRKAMILSLGTGIAFSIASARHHGGHGGHSATPGAASSPATPAPAHKH